MIEAILSVVKSLLRPLFPVTGRPFLWREVEDRASQHSSPAEGLATLDDRLDIDRPTPTVSPVFLLAPIWRSGSTLLQRLVHTSREIWIWGEPYARFQIIQRLAATFEAATEDYPPRGAHSWTEDSRQELTENWIANMAPSPESLVAAHRRFFETWLASPAGVAGDRWGLKSVRLGGEHARYLKWIFPDARFVFLIRNPYEAWLSYYQWRRWFYRYPDRPVVTCWTFGDIWRRRVREFQELEDETEAIMIRYEDLTADPSTVSLIEDHLGTTVDRSTLDTSVGASRDRRTTTGWLEGKVLERKVEPLASRLGYEAR